ncbi:acyl-CoA dehydrogenase family protein [Stackebrandtia nassauensis]|uniref:Acyl-CoA dehydrogenase domain protein n=1 Tax=Stackebrandtia nassauensis (strain DSM 44728 / CIP 108903 / NRRL B-16338 / NBRC 102104 / LLR-40K-21) TaxID=446470 RepID=D3Q9A3_STANL|nr:acyl-CoA dehydrogenase family protein [Stackebrandtia nassauensis]ADD42585.1 acyl-CoA dehydrogenase domain protein [Stackebrandtia nassauensis DSM 44728]
MNTLPTPPAADLLYSETETELRASLRRLLDDRCPPEWVVSGYDTTLDASGLWKAIAVDLGLAAILIPESCGGAGLGAREAAVVLEELGRAAAPVPFLSSAVLATVALSTIGERETLRRLASGDSTAALAVPLSTSPDDLTPTVSADDTGLTGRITTVAGTELADVLLVPVSDGDGVQLHQVTLPADGVTMTPATALDMTRPLTDITLSGAASTRIDSGDAEAAIRQALLCAAALLPSEQYGVASWCLDTTLAYLKQRRQFGRTIGSFQAVKHRMANLWLQVGQTGALARYAADTYARRDLDTEIAVCVAQSFCGDAAVLAAEECVQLHAGIAMTWEYPAHLYLKRAKADQLALGAAHRYRNRLSQLVDLPSH